MSTRITEPQRQLALGGKSKESKPGASGKLLSLVLDQSTKVQEPAVRAYVQKLRATHPTATPADVVAMLEKRYLATVMGSGAAVGAAAAFPGVGTLAALSATAGEAVLFLEATSLFTLALAAVHDIELAKIEHRHTLVLAVLLGEDGETTVSDVLGKERTVGGGWLAEATSTLPVPALSHLNATLLKRFTKKFAVKRGAPADYTAKVPAGLSAEVAASSLLQGITTHYLLTSVYPVAAGDTVLVHAGAGGMGLLLTQWATYRGVRVITTVSSEAKEKLSREAGAAEVLPYPDPADPSEFAAQIRELTAGEGVAVVYDGVGKSTFEASLAAVRVRGLIALYGAASGQVPPFDPQRLTAKSAVLTRPTMGHFIRTPEEFAWRADDVLDLVSRGTLKITIGAGYPLEQAAQAHTDLEARKTTGSVVLVP